MNDSELNAIVASLDPVSRSDPGPGIEAGLDALRVELIATGRHVEMDAIAAIRSLPSRGPQRRRLLVMTAAAAVVTVGAVGVAVNRTSDNDPASIGGQPTQSGSAATGPQTTVGPTTAGVAAITFPPTLLLDDQWTITFFDQGNDGDIGGDLTFTRLDEAVGSSAPDSTNANPTSTRAPQSPGPTVPGTQPPGGTVPGGTPPNQQVQITWSTEDRADAWVTPTLPNEGSAVHGPFELEPTTVLGNPTRIFEINDDDYVAIVTVPEGSIEVRTSATDPIEFEGLLSALRLVDRAEFDAALPEAVVTPEQRQAQVDEMLNDVPIPPGLDLAPIASQPIYSSEASLSGAVASQVACGWFDEWFKVWEPGGDPGNLETAVSALESSHDWAMLTALSPLDSGFPELLWQTVDSLRSGGSVMTGAGPAPISRDAIARLLNCTWQQPGDDPVSTN